MKRFIILLCTILTLTSLAVSVYAAKSVSISLSANDSAVGGGDKVTITVKATVDSCGSGGMEVTYDTNRFELISGEWLLDGTITAFDEKSKNGVFALDVDKKLSGKIFKLVIKVKNDAPLGSGKVTFDFQADRTAVSKSISIKVECNHKYSNNCDTSCNSCGSTRKITHSWNKGEVVEKATCTANGSVKYTCTVCKETKSAKLDKVSHVYDNACDTNCNDCNAKREISHQLAWDCDTTNHWQACSVCGFQQDKAAHAPEQTMTGKPEGHGKLCTICNLIPDLKKHDFESQCDVDCAECGYQRTAKHNYGAAWSYDAESHWQVCSLCGSKTEVQPHTPDMDVADDADQLCTQCGYVVKPAINHVHVMAGEWISDDAGHCYPCHCGEKSDVAPHVWDDGRIDEAAGVVVYHCEDCDYARAEVYIPEPTNAIEKILRIVPLWLILAVGLGISVLVNIVLIISMIASSRRRAKNARFLKQEETVE